ncbi:hypothetical protein Cst04h_18400 [Corynebacterium striatum]|uniref:Uncharacterized protein n=1 Tax=Corynebacterium striatum TaxID=43770 RepID=A0ABC9ZNB9_CORST|nr:hypothetical protein Cst04h_18400 [Corynebacterium striatum]
MSYGIAEITEVFQHLCLAFIKHVFLVRAVDYPPEGIRVLGIDSLAEELLNVVESSKKARGVFWSIEDQSKKPRGALQ